MVKRVVLRSDLFKYTFNTISNYFTRINIILLGENIISKDNCSILFCDLTYTLILKQAQTF